VVWEVEWVEGVVRLGGWRLREVAVTASMVQSRKWERGEIGDGSSGELVVPVVGEEAVLSG
jgi:hypothetical protein